MAHTDCTYRQIAISLSDDECSVGGDTCEDTLADVAVVLGGVLVDDLDGASDDLNGDDDGATVVIDGLLVCEVLAVTGSAVVLGAVLGGVLGGATNTADDFGAVFGTVLGGATNTAGGFGAVFGSVSGGDAENFLSVDACATVLLEIESPTCASLSTLCERCEITWVSGVEFALEDACTFPGGR